MSGKLLAAGVLFGSAALLAVLWSPLAPRRMRVVDAKARAALDSGEVKISPAEVLALMHDRRTPLALLDLREERAWNHFHLLDSRRLPAGPGAAAELLALPARMVKILVDEDEMQSARLYVDAVRAGVKNVYLLQGGLRSWLATYGTDAAGHSTVGHAALGDRHPASDPGAQAIPASLVRKVKLQGAGARKAAGCGG